MENKFQEGIFYNNKPLFPKDKTRLRNNSILNDTFALIFLRTIKKSNALCVHRALINLWKMYTNLKQGLVNGIKSPVPADDLTILIAYGNNIFNLPGITKSIPENFKNKQFLPASPQGPILDGCGIKYSTDMHYNIGLSEDIAIQLVSKSQLATFRAIEETSKHLYLCKNKVLRFSKFFTGFQRTDGRSWLGFHDELSNMNRGKERSEAIFIHPERNALKYSDWWTKDGTYLAFLRTEVDLRNWEKLDRVRQEYVVGRNKETGVPLIGVDKNGNPSYSKFSTKKKSSQYDTRFHDHADFFSVPKVSREVLNSLDLESSRRILSQSHIGRARHMDNLRSGNSSSRRIYRQGYEFMEPVNSNKNNQLRVGLNFISFQNDPSRLFFILTDPNWMGKSNFGGDTNMASIGNLLNILAAGVFFVPPLEKPYPGANIFS